MVVRNISTRYQHNIYIVEDCDRVQKTVADLGTLCYFMHSQHHMYVFIDVNGLKMWIFFMSLL
jgi:hypothetical protein